MDDPKKHWKFGPHDLQERQYWSDYILAYEDILTKTSTAWARWYLIPSNVNWYRNLVVARTVVSALERLEPKYPVPNLDLSQYKIE